MIYSETFIKKKYEYEYNFSLSFSITYSILILNELKFFFINSPIKIKISFKKGLKSKCLK
jgi:hypothetical protein